MYKQSGEILLNGDPKKDPVDLYIMKRGSDILLNLVTSNGCWCTRVDSAEGIRDVEDFTRLCTKHNFQNRTDDGRIKITFEMKDTLVNVDGCSCELTTIPVQLVDRLSGR